ncbi:uncharacterized protein LOC131146368 isoform X2 [Malania oleifera]|uniref:uncharacterized protein LOC131146368 isoform X2 n=1 Tax=Malania oleifera TaxID=397392 RepID=UPI0025ADC2C1|nr:uncharacterized protein LOC131146368 isoform X2 [Malania oleifera]
MSASIRSDSDRPFDIQELLQIRARCKELGKEKDMLKESQSQSLELIRRLEVHVKTLSEACSEDDKQIQELERELRNCSQEIDFLQDQLSSKNTELNFLEKHAHSLELKLAGIENLQKMVGRLQEELRKSNLERLFLMQELDCKEVQLQKSTLYIEKLEESISSVALESQCEIESMKLDLISSEQGCFEANKFKEEIIEENTQWNYLIQELEVQLQEAQSVIESLDKENKELREKLEASEMYARAFCQKIEEHLEEWLEDKDELQFDSQPSFGEKGTKLIASEEIRTCGKVLGPLLSKLTMVVAASHEILKGEMELISHQTYGYELLVKQLKEELREEKLKAKDEAEDLAQEMAELRYQITGLLEQECKRRACIEQASLLRIAELEAQIQNERTKSLNAAKHLHEAQGSLKEDYRNISHE